MSGTDSEPLIRRIETTDPERIVIDFGASEEGVSTDVVDNTIIIIGPDNQQLEFELPDTNARTFMQNGVLTIEIEE